MPVSIPTYLALRFVTTRSLKERINFLQTSYKVQVAGLSTFSLINIDKVGLIKNLPLLTSLSL